MTTKKAGNAERENEGPQIELGTLGPIYKISYDL